MQFEFPGFGPDYADYRDTWDLQRKVHAQVVAGERDDTVLLLEHAAVYTAGKRTEPHELPLDGTPVINVDRGGKITWHGPGQLVGYPILRLPDPIDVVAYVRRLEAAMIAVCAEFGVLTECVEGRTGAWVRADERGPDRKLAAIGIRVARGVTSHGFALNCNCDLGWTAGIVPCGIADAGVSTLSQETGRQISVADVLPTVQDQLLIHLGDMIPARAHA
ncbi:MAG: lipoate-protein ligase B [Micrococcales bacterium]|nr:MAG: lipoate-protein ligase B [Micrococcales bacterium]PIE26318.1 MAG: lipoate-protein ligase B [Micrococcales bacterium]